MPITQVRYSKRYNLGNYESCEVGCVYELDSDETEEEALEAAKEFCDRARPSSLAGADEGRVNGYVHARA
jgi:hypothetical protein